jgi:hypothetical protein
MSGSEFEETVDDSEVAGSPEGDGDFETDQLPSTGETSAGGQVSTRDDTRDGVQGEEEKKGGLAYLLDEISTGKIQP